MSIELESALGGSLGLDVFQIRPGVSGVGGLQSASLVVGRVIANDVFLTVESALGALFGGTEAGTTPFAVRVEWRLTKQYSARFSWEPPNRNAVYRAFTTAQPVARPERRQFSAELRRRWTY
jgi:hypothetical protein